jgi:two-component system sensor histidine kinase BaeS
MKIHNKLFLILFSFTFSIIAGLVVLIQWSIGQGVIDYVNAKEIKALEPLVIKLATQYESSASWDEVIRDNKSFRRLIETELQSSQFSERPGPRSRSMRPPRQNAPALK